MKYALAESIAPNHSQSQEQQKEQTAALEGHDADIPTETQSTASTQAFTTPTQESHPTFPSHAPSAALPGSHNATATADTQSLASTTDAFSEAPEQPSSSTAPAASSSSSSVLPKGQHSRLVSSNPPGGLAPSTVSQWIPEKGSPAHLEDQVTTNTTALGGGGSKSLDKALTPGLEEKETWITPGIASGSAAEAATSAPESITSANPEIVPSTASEATSTKPEAIPASVPEPAPGSAPETTSSTNLERRIESAPEPVTSSVPETAHGTDPEKVPTSTVPVPNGKDSPASSHSEKEVDLEAGHRSEDSDNKDPETTRTEVDPNVVDWDGPDDPQNPVNWSEKIKWANVAVIASITFLTQVTLQASSIDSKMLTHPLASSMLAPAVPEVMTEFKSTNLELASFVVSVYILGYAFGPIIIAPVSELYGRVPVYHVCNVLFIVFTIACAVSSNFNMLIGWRFLQGTFGSCPLTIGGGTISDMILQQKRGGVMAIWALGPLMGPVIGPVAGGYLAQAKGWRWIFWVIAMAAGVITVSAFFSLRESYPPIILERKAKRLRKETGNENLKSKLASPLSPAALFKISIVRPLRLLLFSPIVLALSTYMAVVYGYLYLLFTTITEVYENQYHFSQGTVGLTYLGIGVGSLCGTIIFGIASDRILKAKSKTGEMKAEYRLPPMIPGSFIIPIGLFLYGWTADKHVFWIAPIIGTGLVGVGLLATFMPIQTYLVDAFTIYAASALAANTVLRSLVGALLPLAGRKMYATLGLGWGNSLLAFIAIAMCPIPIIFYKYGERIRKHPRFQVKL
ncbi:hypothetical protein IMSHALPRED_009653 [Imshaugia aleurites]|uniref:Major facilitator superfamily (MFS) profile domain-containing protein n=1 Tax=Imshaugia aleurites TaxID=172621 RepID=A0A8H3G0C5_9LECA|nr:hypothetical protein IMSHALPRED_009653 [Imshaugia aleurites]